MPKLDKEVYTLSKATVKQVLEVLHNNWFSDGGDVNNDDVIDATQAIEKEISAQEDIV